MLPLEVLSPKILLYKYYSNEETNCLKAAEIFKLIFLPLTYCFRDGMEGGNNYYILTSGSTHNRRFFF